MLDCLLFLSSRWVKLIWGLLCLVFDDLTLCSSFQFESILVVWFFCLSSSFLYSSFCAWMKIELRFLKPASWFLQSFSRAINIWDRLSRWGRGKAGFLFWFSFFWAGDFSTCEDWFDIFLFMADGDLSIVIDWRVLLPLLERLTILGSRMSLRS